MARLRKIRGRYFAYFYDPTNRPTDKSFPLRTASKDIAKRMMRRLEREYADGVFDPWNPHGTKRLSPVAEGIDLFLEERSADVRPTTIEAYREVLQNWAKLLPPGFVLNSTNESHFHNYLSDRSVKPATRRKRHRHLNVFFNWCVENGIAPNNPLKSIKAPRVGKSVPKYLTPVQLEKLLLAIDADREIRSKSAGRTPEVQWLKDLILLAVSTGMRLGELLALRWTAVDFDNRSIIVENTTSFRTKSGDERRIPLARNTVDILARRKSETEDSEFVITNKTGRPIQVTYASQRFKHYARLARLPEHVHFHSLRHTCASWLVMQGESLSVVQAILGHSTIAVTEKYASLAPEQTRRAVDRAFADLPMN